MTLGAWRRTVVLLVLALAALVLPGAAAANQPTTADEPARLEWNPTWPRFRPTEVALTSGLILQVAAVTFLYPAPEANWRGGILFDDAVRGALRLPTKAARARADQVSDAIYYGLLAYPLVVDAGIVAGGIHRSGDVALQLMAMDLEAYAFSGAIALSAEKLGRVRPEERECKKDAGYSDDCGHPAQLNASFMSGHTTMAFTGAGLICAHHLNLPLYGGGAPDTLACVTALTAAATAGAMRVAADKHYTTDVLLGMAVGLFGGYGLPTLLHYGARGPAARQRSFLPTFRSERAGIAAVVAPALGPGSTGVMLVGTF
jgi:membrane-associated phospholipid phosphatase